MPLLWNRQSGTPWLLAVLLLTAANLAHGADELKENTSLQFVPADSAFYATSLRLREQWESFANSRAVAKLFDLKTAKLLREGYNSSPQAQMAVGMAAGSDEVQEVLKLLGEMASDEMFIIGDSAWGKVPAVAAELQSLARKAAREDFDPAEVLQIVEKFQLPSVLVGFRVRTPEMAKDALDKLEGLLSDALSEIPDLEKKFKRIKLAGGDFLSLQLDGSMIPWDNLGDAEITEEQKAAVSKKTIVLNLGLRGNYVLAFIGPANAALEKLGQGPFLYDRPEMARLRKHAGEKIVSIAYVSEEMRRREDPAAMLENMQESLQPALELLELSEETIEKLHHDLDELAKSLKTEKLESGPNVSVTFLSPKGYTSFDEDWSENPRQDGSQPLDLLQHVGGSPLIVCAERTKDGTEDYKLLVKILTMAYANLDRIAEEKLDDEDMKEQYEKVKTVALPLLKRLDKATGTMLLPALRDGQGAFVVDAKLASKQWHNALNKSDKPLPVFEPAMLIGVSDAELLKKGVAEYIAVLNEVMSKLHEEFPDSVQDWTVPLAESETTDAGTFYSYPIPKESGLDGQFGLHAVVSKTLAAVTLNRQQADRLVTSTPLKLEGPAGQIDRPLVSIDYCNFAGIIDVVDAWVEYAGAQPEVLGLLNTATQALDKKSLDEDKPADDDDDEDTSKPKKPAAKPKDEVQDDEPKKPELSPADLIADIRTVLTILKCARGHSRATFIEGRATVTHAEWYYQDLPAERAAVIPPPKVDD